MTTLSELQTQIRDYTETDNQVLTDVIVNDFIEHSEYRPVSYTHLRAHET